MLRRPINCCIRPLAASVHYAGPNNGALGLALEERVNGEAVVAIAGAGSDSRTMELWRAATASYRPGKAVIRIDEDDKNARLPDAMKSMYEAAAHRDTPLAFVCAGTACALPSTDAAALAKTIREFRDRTAAIAGGLATR